MLPNKSGFSVNPQAVKLLTLVVCALVALPAGASAWQDVAAIQASAEDFVRNQLTNDRLDAAVEARAVDNRLRLRSCEAPLEAYLPPGGTLRDNGVIGVRCTTPVAWKLFVPVRIVRQAAVARIYGQLPAGHRLRAGDIRWEKQVVQPNANLMLRGQSDPIGQVLRHAAHDGQVLRMSMLRAAHVVRRGDVVTLAVSGNSLGIRMQGEALANGAIGQRLRVRNRSSGRVVEGIVRDEGLIEIMIF
ncbi:MAG: flagellar basal body P-ring formation chaperone FlgA [Gammaproteobacteria bacterium]